MTTAGCRSRHSLDYMPFYSSYVLKNSSTEPVVVTMSVPGGEGQGQQGGDNFNNRNVNYYPPYLNFNIGRLPTFHTPSFGDEDFDLPPLSLPTDQESSGNVSQQPFSHQMLANLDLGLNQPLSASSSMQTANCTPLSSMRGVHPVAPKFPPQNFDVPDINVTNSVMANSDNIFSSIAASTGAMFHNTDITSRTPISSHQTLSTISQSQMANQLGFHTAVQGTSPAGSNSTSSPSRESSEDSDDSLPLAQLMSMKRAAAPPPQMPPVELAPVTTVEPPTTTTTTTTVTATQPAAPSAAKKQKTPKKKKKKDPNEPQKPVSAYALFFRDTQAAIKGQSPNKSFGDVSKIVASMWDSLDPENKSVYKKKTEVAKKEYLKQLAAYRASQVSQAAQDEASSRSEKSPSPPMVTQMSTMPQGGGTQMGMMSQMNRMNLPSPPQQTQMMSNAYTSPPHQPMQQLQNLTSQPPQQTMMQQQHQQQQNNGMVYQPSPEYTQNLSPMDCGMSSNGLCVRNGCINHAIENPGWDNEYCSNECVVSHCRDIFTAWVASKQGGSTFQVK